MNVARRSEGDFEAARIVVERPSLPEAAGIDPLRSQKAGRDDAAAGAVLVLPRKAVKRGYIFVDRQGNSLEAVRYTTSSGAVVISTLESAGDRRANLVLRALIDEMLERVRGLNATPSTLTTDERSRAEAELESIMARVRRYAALRDQ